MDAERAHSTAPRGSVAVSPALAFVALVLAVLLGVQGAGFWLFRDRGPSAETHEAAAAMLRAEHRPGDLIFLYPAYATEGREHLGDLDVLAVRRPLREDLEARERVWIYALAGSADALRAAFSAAGHEEVRSERLDGLELSVFRLAEPRAEVRWRALEHLREAKVVHVHPDGREEACARWTSTPLGGKWVCPHDSAWLYVGPEHHMMGEHVRECLWAHPPKTGELVVRFPRVPLAGTLAGYAGHTLNASTRAHAPVFLDARVEGAPGQRFRFALEDTWRPFRMRTPTSTTATVTFAVSSRDNGANHFCFTADAREVPR